MVQARPVLSIDLPRPLPHLLASRPARRPVYPVDATIQEILASVASEWAPPPSVAKFMALRQQWEPAPWALIPPARER